VPGQQEDQNLVPDVLCGQSCAGLRVAGGQEQRDQVRLVAACTAALVDDGVYDVVERLTRFGSPPLGRRRPVPGQPQRVAGAAADVLAEDRKGGPDDRDRVVDVGAEQDPADHPEGVFGHLGVQVDQRGRCG
jgi:hypothetical protein